MIVLWPLLLPIAAASGWLIAHKQFKTHHSPQHNFLNREYVVGLNYLLNEQPDKAVDIFIKLLDVDSDTVETHLALGSLFRRRGEVDRAIRIHQNLIARPQLKINERKEALLALGHDYFSAGMFDRAERIFKEVTALDNNLNSDSLYGLLAIYHQEKSWQEALNVISKLEKCTGTNLNALSAMYHCELASQCLVMHQFDRATLLIHQALKIDAECVRANMMLASIEIEQGRFKNAINALKQIPKQDPAFTSEIIDDLVLCYKKIDSLDDCVNYLESSFKITPTASALFVIASYIQDTQSIEAAIDYMSTALSQYPSIRGLNKLIELHLESAYGKVKEKLQMLYEITSSLLVDKPVYRCQQCGFSGKHLHWHCPSCKQWGKMKPIYGLEGE